jgi:hypothetical protein
MVEGGGLLSVATHGKEGLITIGGETNDRFISFFFEASNAILNWLRSGTLIALISSTVRS